MVDAKDIQHLTLFQNLSPDELKAVAAIVSSEVYEKGQTVFEEGQCDCPCIYIVQKGRVDVAKRNKDGDFLTLSVLREESFFGEMSFLDGKPHSATITTATDAATVLKIDRKDFDSFAQVAPQTGYKILFNIVHEIIHLVRKMNSQYIDLAGYVFGRTKR